MANNSVPVYPLAGRTVLKNGSFPLCKLIPASNQTGPISRVHHFSSTIRR